MQHHVTRPIGRHLDDTQAAAFEPVAHCRLKRRPVGDARVATAEALDERAKVQPVRCAEQGFELIVRQIRLGQERKDATAVVVDQHHDQVQPVLAGSQQAIQVVIEGHVANDQHDRPDARGAGAQRAGDDAVDAVGAAIRQAAQRLSRGRQERIEVAHRHAIARVEQSAFGQRDV